MTTPSIALAGANRTDLIAELASPGPNSPMTAKVRRVAAPIQDLASEIADELTLDEKQLRSVLAPRVSGLGFNLRQSDVTTRAAWWLLGQWLTGYALGAFPATASLADAESWFYGPLRDALPQFAPHRNMGDIASLASPEEVWALLPYLLDPLEAGTRRDVLAAPRSEPHRRERKTKGIFYTPADVANWMVDTTQIPDKAWTCLDPACGSGVFLRAALLRDRRTGVYGVDLEPSAAEMAAFVVLSSCIADGAPWLHWHLARIRLATLNALALGNSDPIEDDVLERRRDEVESARRQLLSGSLPALPADLSASYTTLALLFPELRDGADVLLSNPPYAPLDTHVGVAANNGYMAFSSSAPTPRTNMFIPFTEHCWRLTKKSTGSAAIVLPLAFSFGRDRHLQDLRKAMARIGGWSCAFFDRTPDALFGDDVKTRNAVLAFDAQGSSISTTGLLRWTSRTRRQFLRTITFAQHNLSVDQGIPKVGSSGEAKLLEGLRYILRNPLANDVQDSASICISAETAAAWQNSVFVSSTAYNWFNCMRDLRPAVNAGHTSESTVHAMRFASSTLADAAYSLLSSRVVYWLWRVEGDAFHVNKSFLLNLPLSLSSLSDALEQLSSLGMELWACSASSPNLALNRGRISVAFPPTAPHLLETIDDTLLNALDIQLPTRDFDLTEWYRQTVLVDDQDSRRVSRMRGAA